MSSLRETLHLRLTAVALVGAIGLPLLLHKPELPDPPSVTSYCVATLLAGEDLGPHGGIAVVFWRCPPTSSVDRWIDIRR